MLSATEPHDSCGDRFKGRTPNTKVMDSTTALTIVNGAIANLKDALSSILPQVIPTVIVVLVLFALLRWAFGAARRG